MNIKIFFFGMMIVAVCSIWASEEVETRQPERSDFSLVNALANDRQITTADLDNKDSCLDMMCGLPIDWVIHVVSAGFSESFTASSKDTSSNNGK